MISGGNKLARCCSICMLRKKNSIRTPSVFAYHKFAHFRDNKRKKKPKTQKTTGVKYRAVTEDMQSDILLTRDQVRRAIMYIQLICLD